MTDATTRTLGVFLEPAPGRSTRVGTLLREPHTVRFIVDRAYLELGPSRPILSCAFYVPGDEARTWRLLQDENKKIASANHLPPYFAHLLPEGFLRDLVERQSGEVQPDDFTILERLGADLPGAVVVRPEGGGQVEREARPIPASHPARGIGPIKFSLAGVQPKFSMHREGDRLTIPASGEVGRYLVKLPAKDVPSLPETELTCMRLAAAAGVNVAECRLVPREELGGVPDRLLEAGPMVLVVERFDRDGTKRIHMEEIASVLGAPDKYMHNQETIVKVVTRFSRRPEDALEAVRRVVVNLLLRNGDAHLKNWAFLYASPAAPELSPAYDIMSTVLYDPDDGLAIPFNGKTAFDAIKVGAFSRMAGFVGIPDRAMRREVTETIDRAAAAWPKLLEELPCPPDLRRALRDHWPHLQLKSRQRRNPFDQRSILLIEEGAVIAEIDDIRGDLTAPPEGSADPMSFTVPPTVVLDLAKSHALQLAPGSVRPIVLRSVRPRYGRTRQGRTFVRAEHAR